MSISKTWPCRNDRSDLEASRKPFEKNWKTVWFSPPASYLRPEIHWMLKYLGCATIPWGKYKCDSILVSQWLCIYWLYIDFGCFCIVLVLEMLFYTLLEIGREFRFIWPVSLTMTYVCIRRFSNAWLLWKNLWKCKTFWELTGSCHNFYIFITSVWVFWYYYLDGKWCKEY